MKFVLFSLIMNLPHPLTGEKLTDQQKFRNVLRQAELAEKLGFDGFGVGERHGPPFLSAAPPVILASIAARTERIRLLTTVTVLSVLDPVRVAEDYATLDHLSGGRLDIIIGKGNDPRHYPLFGLRPEEQWDSLAERYELLRRLWSEEEVTWEGRYRPSLENAAVWPKPLQRPIRIWHGSASSEISTELAAKYGEPLFSSNAAHEQGKYKALIDHYRDRLAFHGHDPTRALVGAGTGGLYIADTKEAAIERYRPYYNTFSNTEAARHNRSPFVDAEDYAARSSGLIGSPDSVIEKILDYHRAFGNQVLGISVDGLTESEQEEQMARFAEEVAPVLRRELPNSLWT
ncbi:LLM class flavin-dependent oxidoreductase [Cohnella fermenti]|uniref:LLM class flavin-dependent oxidoreductase n=1 Tax=Cohnella fermenti TaxID=2565925 RepID=A0A4S4BN37_9BACL|nr:LLM class flavin-dependent oxidoreductase [Cohnella fermenti]THF75342.1 LLM class flavin-dependent oxidoreductase [Cohnella fermenti]